MKKLDKFKTSTACALVLATAPIFAETKTNQSNDPNAKGKSQISIDTIVVDKEKSQVGICPAPEKTANIATVPNRILSLAFNTESKQAISVTFNMATLPSTSEEQVLVLFHGRCLLDSPKISTPKSLYKLALDLKDIEILGAYNVPNMHPIQHVTRIGRATTLSTQMTFTVHLDPSKLGKEMAAGNRTFYIQAGLLNKQDFHTRKYENLILSPVEAVHFSAKDCPDITQLTENMAKKNSACIVEKQTDSHTESHVEQIIESKSGESEKSPSSESLEKSNISGETTQ